MVELPIEERYVPNVYLSAVMISDAESHLDSKQLVVPPVQQFLKVAVKADREQYQPRDNGSLTITTTDVDGKPVAAEVGFGLYDESVKYIQSDYAGDPRQFYYGSKRGQNVQTQSSFDQKAYVTLVQRKNGQLIDRKNAGEETNEDDVTRVRTDAEGRAM